jgi:spermidine/putrescine transport system permease protein
MVSAREAVEAADRRDIRNRWLLSAPALLIIFFAAAGPLFVMLLYSFMAKGDYGDVKLWQFSSKAGSASSCSATSSTTRCRSDAHLAIIWRSVKLSIATTVLTLASDFRRPISSPRGRSGRAGSGCS